MQSSFQLSIRHLFYATALIASGLAVHPMTFFFSVLVLAFWWLVFSDHKPNTLKVLHFITVIAVLWSIFITLLALLPFDYGHYWRSGCRNNMRQIMIGLFNYESAFQKLPPAQMVSDATGDPMHSWRVLILPYIEGQSVYNQYNFDEPWNGPNNSKLVNQMPPVFSCPHFDVGDGMTTYKLISDTGAAFDGNTARNFADIDDGTSATIALVEDIKNPVNWMKPDDVNIETAIKILTENQTHHHVQEETFQRLIFPAHVGMMDGSIVSLDIDANTIPELLSSMSIGDGYFTELSTGGPTRVETKWGAYLGLLIYIVLAIAPLFSVKNRLKNEPTIGAEL